MVITGHRGFIGSHLSKKFKDFYGIDLKEGNDILKANLPDADTVIHLAAQTKVIDSIDNPIYDATQNILGTIRLAKKYKNSKFVFASSGGAIQEKIESPYGLSKFCAEEYIKMICDDYVILRFPNIYGPGSHSVVEKFLNGPIYIYGDGTSTRDYVFVGDLVEVITEAVHWPKGTYSLGSEESIAVQQIAEWVSERFNKPIIHTDRIPGELQHSLVPNNTSWKPKTKLKDYICTIYQS